MYLSGRKAEVQKSISLIFGLNEKDYALSMRLMPFLELIAHDGMKVAEEMYSDGESEYELLQETLQQIQYNSEKFADTFTTRISEALAKNLQLWEQGNESMDQLVKRVETVFKKTKDWKALRDAKTQSVYHANYGLVDGYRQSGMKHLRWYARGSACEYCRGLNGMLIPIDTAFVSVGKEIEGEDGGSTYNDYETVSFPPLHPNCVCSVSGER